MIQEVAKSVKIEWINNFKIIETDNIENKSKYKHWKIWSNSWRDLKFDL